MSPVFTCLGRLLAACWLLLTPVLSFAQTGGVGIGTTTPAASAALDVSSTTKGFLGPRMSTSQRDAIASPATGLTIYNTTTNKLNTWNGTSWDAAVSTTEQPFAGTAVTFIYTGAPQTYTVPAGITALTVDAAGAGGGMYPSGRSPGGSGARVQATLAVTPGEVLTLYVGGAGINSGAGGYNGGGTGSADESQGAGGGGASDVRRSATAPSTALAERLLVAGGGGGGGGTVTSNSSGGGGGAPNGLNGAGNLGGPGLGATQTEGGSAGGTLGQGGGASGSGGGGGGGYYGGGGGGFRSGGGGGSSWVTATGSSGPVLTASYRAGNGVIVLTPSQRFVPVDGSSFVNVPGDNLGNHTATQNLNLGANALTGTGNNLGTTVGVGVRADGGLNLGQNTTGNNILLGYGAGANTTGIQNTFLGYAAGSNTTTGYYNTFIGYAVGNANTDGTRNTFVGTGSGNANISGSFNHFSGYQSGLINTTGSNNTFEGAGAGINNTTGSNNTVLGYNSGPAVNSGALDNATAIGANVTLTTNNTVVLGNSANVGIGTPAPAAGLHVLTGNSGVSSGTGALLSGPPTGNPNLELRGGSTTVTPYVDLAETSGVDYSSRLISQGGTLNVYATNTTALRVNGNAAVTGTLTVNGVNVTSDQRFKQHIRPLTSALTSVLALRGVRYEWNALGIQHGGTAGASQVGVLAQEVEKVYPELVSTDKDGYKAVNYAQLTPVLLEAIKELKAENDALKARTAAAEANAGTAKAQAAQATATLESFEARLRRLEAAAGGQAQR